MAGKRQPLAALQANGRNHLTKAEIAERSAAEVHLKKPKRISVPAWLPEDLKGDFRKISKELLDAGAVRGSHPHGAGLAGSGKHGNLLLLVHSAGKVFQAGPGLRK